MFVAVAAPHEARRASKESKSFAVSKCLSNRPPAFCTELRCCRSPSHPAPSHPPHPIPPPTPNPPTPACPSGNPRDTNTLPGAMEKSSINLLLRKGRSHNGTNKFSFSEQPGTSLGQLAYKCGQTTSCSLRRSETRGLYCSPPVLNTMQSLEGFTSQPASQSSVRMGK